MFYKGDLLESWPFLAEVLTFVSSLALSGGLATGKDERVFDLVHYTCNLQEMKHIMSHSGHEAGIHCVGSMFLCK